MPGGKMLVWLDRAAHPLVKQDVLGPYVTASRFKIAAGFQIGAASMCVRNSQLWPAAVIVRHAAGNTVPTPLFRLSHV